MTRCEFRRIHVLPDGEDRFRVVLREREGGEQVLGEGLPLGYAQCVAEDWGGPTSLMDSRRATPRG